MRTLVNALHTVVKKNTLRAALEIVVGARKDKYLVMLNKTSPEFQKEGEDLVKWAMDTLEKDDRINWFLKRARLSDETYRETDTKAKQAWSEERKDGMAKQTKPLEWLKEKIGHYIENAKVNKYGLVLNRTFKSDEKTAELFEDLERLENESFLKKGKNARYLPTPDKTFIKLNNDWEWQIIEYGYCEREGRAMKHCGNKPSAKPGDNVLSLRKKLIVDGKEVWEPHATFILNDGVIGEMKGFDNKKPGKDLHPHILELLEDKRITRVKGGGYLSKENFKFKDLSETDLARIEKSRDDLVQNVGTGLEELAERIDEAYQGDEEYHRSEDNWGEYLSDAEIDISDLDDDMKELIDDLENLTPDWEDELRNLADSSLEGMYTTSNEIASMGMGTDERELSEDLAEEIDNLNDAEKDELKSTLSSDTSISDDLSYFYVGGDYDRAVLSIDEDTLRKRVDELKEARDMAESEDTDYAEKQALENKHDDVRLEAVDKIDNQGVLEEVALKDKNKKVQKAAVKKLENQEVLEKIALDTESDPDVRKTAISKIENDDVLKSIAENTDDYYGQSEAFEYIKDLEYIKKAALEEITADEDSYKGTWKQGIAAEKIDDPEFLKELLNYELTSRSENHTQDRIVIEILNKLDPEEDEELFKKIAGLPKQEGHWNRNTMQPYAVSKIKDQEFLKEFIESVESKEDSEDFLEVAYQNVTDQDWLKAKLMTGEVEETLATSLISNIKDDAFLIKYLTKEEKKKPFSEYRFTDLAVSVSEVTQDQKLLQKIASHPNIWYYRKREPAIKKITDPKFLFKLADNPPDRGYKSEITKFVTDRLEELGLSESEIKEGIKKAKEKAKKKKATTKKATTKKATTKKKTSKKKTQSILSIII